MKACFCRLQSGCLPAHLPTCLLSVVLFSVQYTRGLIVWLSVCFFFQFRLPTVLRFMLSVCRPLPACLLPTDLLSVYSQSAVSSVCRLSNSTCSVSCLFCLWGPCLSVFPPANLAACVPGNLLFFIYDLLAGLSANWNWNWNLGSSVSDWSCTVQY